MAFLSGSKTSRGGVRTDPRREENMTSKILPQAHRREPEHSDRLTPARPQAPSLIPCPAETSSP